MYFLGWNGIKSTPPFISKEKTLITDIFNIYLIYQEGKKNEWRSLKGRREEGKDLSFLIGQALGLTNKWKYSFLKQQLPSRAVFKIPHRPPQGYTLMSLYPSLWREWEIPPNLTKSFSSQKICSFIISTKMMSRRKLYVPPPRNSILFILGVAKT